ncbi:mitochondrial ribosomal protein S18 (bS18m) [Andalucia godoyi]|uniref:Mitochondrial ribosomal protein S18 (BS18m) n=1 Tax=Andalucia godoyi TaxID=505711 RepID=A0A8K0AGJ0_ANDGO|nr:mitochondrial ribosomal protein S18 (bS18m) [Andalucia godoyi]|eukprot:ANDGO_06513.mRNA.1 mitochondrial ribosomal protein S18 (bS18m)
MLLTGVLRSATRSVGFAGLRCFASGTPSTGFTPEQPERLNAIRPFYPGQFYEPDELNPETSKKRFIQPKRDLSCPLSAQGAPEIDFKNVKLLSKFVSETGKLMPKRLSGVVSKKQRELATAIKRARFLAFIPYTARPEVGKPPKRY